MRRIIVLVVFFALFSINATASTLDAPTLTSTTSGVNVSISWTSVSGATGYSLVYAPNPYSGPSSIGTIDMGTNTSLSVDLWSGAAFYVAVTANNGFETSTYSNVELIQIVYSNQPGDVWADPLTGMVFIWVPSGCYEMGCGSWTTNCDSDEIPAHQVCLDGFWIGKYEVTQGQWKSIIGSNPSAYDSSDNYPVEKVSWNDSQNFINQINSQGTYTFRLPTEAEWEYAARSGGNKEKYSGGDDVDSVAWYSSNSNGKTHEVGTKLPNGIGIHDMSGNVWEWCSDWYTGDYYSTSPTNNPQGPSSSNSRVARGSSWGGDSNHVRTTYRDSNSPDSTIDSLGLRLLRVD